MRSLRICTDPLSMQVINSTCSVVCVAFCLCCRNGSEKEERKQHQSALDCSNTLLPWHGMAWHGMAGEGRGRAWRCEAEVDVPSQVYFGNACPSALENEHDHGSLFRL